MRRMEDGNMHRRMQKNKHIQGNDLDTPTLKSSLPFRAVTSFCSVVIIPQVRALHKLK